MRRFLRVLLCLALAAIPPGALAGKRTQSGTEVVSGPFRITSRDGRLSARVDEVVVEWRLEGLYTDPDDPSLLGAGFWDDGVLTWRFRIPAPQWLEHEGVRLPVEELVARQRDLRVDLTEISADVYSGGHRVRHHTLRREGSFALYETFDGVQRGPHRGDSAPLKWSTFFSFHGAALPRAEVIRVASREVELRNFKVSLQLSGSGVSEAERVFKARRAQSEAQAIASRGRQHLQARRFDEAIEAFREAARLDPEGREAYQAPIREAQAAMAQELTRGAASKAERGELAEAVSSFEQAAQIDPSNRATYLAQAEQLRREARRAREEAKLEDEIRRSKLQAEARRVERQSQAEQAEDDHVFGVTDGEAGALGGSSAGAAGAMLPMLFTGSNVEDQDTSRLDRILERKEEVIKPWGASHDLLQVSTHLLIPLVMMLPAFFHDEPLPSRERDLRRGSGLERGLFGPRGLASWSGPKRAWGFDHGVSFSHYQGRYFPDAYPSGPPGDIDKKTYMAQTPGVPLDDPMVGAALQFRYRARIFRFSFGYAHYRPQLLQGVFPDGIGEVRALPSRGEDLHDLAPFSSYTQRQSFFSLDMSWGLQFFHGLFSPHVSHRMRWMSQVYTSGHIHLNEHLDATYTRGMWEMPLSHELVIGNTLDLTGATFYKKYRSARVLLDLRATYPLHGVFGPSVEASLGYSFSYL
ncbi:MAG: hypothetical protein EA397_04150 [Deltaproteobacteria bacterium]|nr:MAG: hypothetical protein EA397_04150 [Deltaproteobacteria bacterium]